MQKLTPWLCKQYGSKNSPNLTFLKGKLPHRTFYPNIFLCFRLGCIFLKLPLLIPTKVLSTIATYNCHFNSHFLLSKSGKFSFYSYIVFALFGWIDLPSTYSFCSKRTLHIELVNVIRKFRRVNKVSVPTKVTVNFYQPFWCYDKDISQESPITSICLFCNDSSLW